jgi:hypothetical protein
LFADETFTTMDEYDSAIMLVVQGVYDIWDKMRRTVYKLVNWKAYQQLISIYFENITLKLRCYKECHLQNLLC